MVRGDLAPTTYPYEISLQVNFFFVWFHFCGGSIVTARHIVTAAHCLEKFNVNGITIWAGSTSLNGNGQRYMIERYAIHPDYLLDKQHNPRTSDIGIITILGSFKFSENVSAFDGIQVHRLMWIMSFLEFVLLHLQIKVIAYSAEEIGGGAKCVSIGWGSTSTTDIGNFPNELQRIEQITTTHAKCSAIWHAAIDMTCICAESELEQGFCSVC